ncbi:MAG: hypothetical protein RLZZ175_3035 [Bacteroidota bacterium]|jgi:hypothetical protein
MFDTAIEKLSTDGVKVVATVEDSVYFKLGACIIISVIIATLGSSLVKGIFSNGTKY